MKTRYQQLRRHFAEHFTVTLLQSENRCGDRFRVEVQKVETGETSRRYFTGPIKAEQGYHRAVEGAERSNV